MSGIDGAPDPADEDAAATVAEADVAGAATAAGSAGPEASVGAATAAGGDGDDAVGDADPWLALDEPTASPARVDATARERLGRFAVDDVRRSAGLTSWLVRRAAADGSTTLDGTVWAAALRGYGIDSPRPGLDAAAAAGRVVALPSERAIAHPRWGPLEERIADDLHAIVASGGPDEAPDDPFDVALQMPVCVVATGLGVRLDDWSRRLRKRADAVGRPVTIVEAADQLDLATAAEILEDHDVDASLVFAGDPDQLEPAAPGRFFGDVVASGVVPIVRLPAESSAAIGAGVRIEADNSGSDGGGSDGGGDAAADSGGGGGGGLSASGGPSDSGGASDGGRSDGPPAPIVRLVESLRTGQLAPIEPGQHAVVVSPVADAAQAVARVVELVTEALPRVLGVGPSDLLVLGIRSAGAAGVEALREAVGSSGIEVAPVHEAVGRRAEAVVLALPAESAGSLTRAHLISAASTAGRQLSIVHQAGPALAAAVQLRPHRPRHTRLARLLRS